MSTCSNVYVCEISFFKCNQSDADREVSPFPGHCPEVNRHCVKWYPNYPNDKAKKYCEDWVPCSDCEAVSIL